MRLYELPDRLHEMGVEPIESDGWRGRGFEFPVRPRGALRHWTVGPRTGVMPSAKTVTFGRGRPGDPDYLPGPLAQVLQTRESGRRDRALVIASGIANHAGKGGWRGLTGNSSVAGLEIEWSGPAEPFPLARVDVSERIMAALIACCDGRDADNACEHREWAPTRKIDTNLDAHEMRRDVRSLITPQPPAPPAPPGQENDLPTVVAADITVNPANPTQGYKLDAYGGLHAIGGAPARRIASYDGWVAAGVSPARRVLVTEWSSFSGYVLDALGGLHPFGSAPPWSTPGYWPNAFVPPAAPV